MDCGPPRYPRAFAKCYADATRSSVSHPLMPASSNQGVSSSLIQWLAMLSAEASQKQDGVPEEMRQAQAAFKSLVDSLPLNLLIKDASGRRIFANKSYLALHQKKIEDIVGKTDHDLFPPDLARKFTTDDLQIVRTGETTRDTEQHQTPGGERRWIDRIKGPLRDADGHIVGVQVLFWDVTDREQAQI